MISSSKKETKAGRDYELEARCSQSGIPDCSKVALLKILLDEMYAGLKEYFETLGWQVLTVHEVGLQGAKDKDVVEYAKMNDLLLVTQDQKPAELAELTGVKYVLISNASIARIADSRIREKYPNA
jgi:predicted nuclease of predicted toxin-antitoxin system